MDHTISIIVPVYNVEKYLRRAIDSILNQTYPHLEILLIDDGSTDHSGLICEEYSQMDKRVTVYHKQNGGLSDARNFGLKKATGQYIGFVDSDDYLHPEMYRIMYNALQDNDCDIAEVDFEMVHDSNKMPIINEISEVLTKKFDHTEAMINIMLDYCGNYAWNKLYKRELWNKIEFPYGRLFEDVATTYKIVDAASSMIRIYIPLYYYTVRAGSIVTSKMTREKELQHLKGLNEMLLFIAQKRHQLLPIACIHYFEGSLGILYNLMQLKRNCVDTVDEIKYIEKQVLNYAQFINDKNMFIKFYEKNIGIDKRFILKKRKKIMVKIHFIKKSILCFYILMMVRTRFLKIMKEIRMSFVSS